MYNPKKHHRHSIRLKNYDYNDGFYFVTICCQNRACIFGEIKNGIMMPNEYGKIAINEWLKTESIRSNVKLYEFVVMPNHIHGILEINHIPNTTITVIEETKATVVLGKASLAQYIAIPAQSISKSRQEYIIVYYWFI